MIFSWESLRHQDRESVHFHLLGKELHMHCRVTWWQTGRRAKFIVGTCTCFDPYPCLSHQRHLVVHIWQNNRFYWFSAHALRSLFDLVIYAIETHSFFYNFSFLPNRDCHSLQYVIVFNNIKNVHFSAIFQSDLSGQGRPSWLRYCVYTCTLAFQCF